MHTRRLGVALSVLAVVVTVAQGSLAVLLDLAINRGDLIVLASQALWVVYSVYTRRAPSGLPPTWVMAGAHLVSAVVLVPISLLIDPPWPSPLGAPRGWLVILYGALPVTLGHLWYYAIVRTIGPARAAIFLNLMPFAVIALTWAMLGEPVHAYHPAGRGPGDRRRVSGDAAMIVRAARGVRYFVFVRGRRGLAPPAPGFLSSLRSPFTSSMN